MSAMIYTIANQKGGVGKTTTTHNLANAAVERGDRVLVVDFDNQGSLTWRVTGGTYRPPGDYEDGYSLIDVLHPNSGVAAEEVILRAEGWGFDLLPAAGERMVSMETLPWGQKIGRESRLRNVLEPLRESYDLILIDTTPSLSLALTLPFYAADGVILVCQPDDFNIPSLSVFMETVQAVRDELGQPLPVGGIINRLTNDNMARQRVTDISDWFEAYGIPLLDRPIQQTAQMQYALSSGRSLSQYNTPQSRELATVYRRCLERMDFHARGGRANVTA